MPIPLSARRLNGMVVLRLDLTALPVLQEESAMRRMKRPAMLC